MLQNAAFLSLFRTSEGKLKPVRLEQLQAQENPPATLESIFAEISHDRMSAARQVLSYLRKNPQPQEFINGARRLVFLKGNNSHDYKFSSAVLEDYQNVSAEWRNQFLAASVFNLRGSGDKDNELVKRTRAALG
jgi:pantoate kinase